MHACRACGGGTGTGAGGGKVATEVTRFTHTSLRAHWCHLTPSSTTPYPKDLLEDVAASDEALIDEFTTSDGGGWGWADGTRVQVRCRPGETNLGNVCVREPDMWATG